MTYIQTETWDQIHPTLKAMLKDLEGYLGEQTITSAYRKDDPGVHGQWPSRGLDIKCQDPIRGRQIEDYLNGHWQYDPNRPQFHAALYHNAGGGWHIHMQCHPNTKKKF